MLNATNAKKKLGEMIVNDNNITIPVSIFSSRTFSVLETIVLYLKTNYVMSFNQIATILGKNYRTIWTVYQRSMKKLEHARIKAELNKNAPTGHELNKLHTQSHSSQITSAECGCGARHSVINNSKVKWMTNNKSI